MADIDTPSDLTEFHEAPDFGTNVGDKILHTPGVETLVSEHAPAGPAATSAPARSSRCNVGPADQKMRLGAGATLLAAAALAPVGRNARIALGAIGVAALLTGATRYCPVSQALGINTCSSEQ
jgi:hypothetical protein